MSFNKDNFIPTSTSANSNAGKVFQYKDDKTLNEMLVPGYFNLAAESYGLKDKDVVMLVGNNGVGIAQAAVIDGADVTLTDSVNDLSNPDAIDRLKQAAARRVDVVMIGDSNQLKGGYGFSRGISNNLANKYGNYATPIFSGDVLADQNQGITGVLSQLGWATDTPSPALADLFINSRSIDVSKSVNAGVIVPGDNPVFDVSSNLRWWMAWGGQTSGAGSFTPRIRLEESPYSGLVTGDPVLTNTGAEDFNMSHLDLPAAARTLDLKGGFAITSTITAPFNFLFYRCEDLLRDSGTSCHVLYAGSGQSLWDASTAISGYSDNQLTAYFTEVRRLQLAKGYKPSVVVYINSGLNDRNETSLPSLGAYSWGIDGSSVENYTDNLLSITDKIESVFFLNGWDVNELAFLTIASHVVSNPNDVKLQGYRDGLIQLAVKKNNLTTVDLSTLMTYDEAVLGGWYVNPTTETEHLTQVGYDAVTSLMLD